MNRASLATIALALAPALAAPRADAQAIAITGGRVFPVSGPAIENGTVLIRDGRIVAVGANVTVPADARRIDASGRWVTPGFFNSATRIGIVEIGFGGPPSDATARGREAIAASFAAWQGLNPQSVLIGPARNEGITSVIVAPTGGMVSGQAALIDLVPGDDVPGMVRRAPVVMVGQIGDARSAGVGARGELIGKMRELLEDARAYSRRRADFDRNQTRPFIASRSDLEAMIPVVEGRLPLVLAANRASDITGAIRLAQEFGVRLYIAGGEEAWMVADQLAAARVPVFTGAMNNIPGSFATLGSRQENAAMLRRAGVEVILIGNAGGADEDLFNVRNIRQQAGNAVAYGMSWDDALRAVTLAPAQAFGVADRVGTLQAGRDANVVVWSGDPFEFSSRAEHVFVRGVDGKAPSRQDELMERYRTLPPSYRP